MAAVKEIAVSEHIKKVPSTVRPIVQAARRAVKAVAPKADEISYQSQPPRSTTYMWKIVRYAVDGHNVVGIGTFATHYTLFFYQGCVRCGAPGRQTTAEGGVQARTGLAIARRLRLLAPG